MGYQSLAEAVADLEKHGHLVRVTEEVDPHLEMAAIHLRVYQKGGPALLFENIKGSKFPALSNLFGTLERSKFLFRDTLERMKLLVTLKNNPLEALKNPLKYLPAAATAFSALPEKLGEKHPLNLRNAASATSLKSSTGHSMAVPLSPCRRYIPKMPNNRASCRLIWACTAFS